VIRAHGVKVQGQAAYNEYFQRQVRRYQEYVAGKADALGFDLEVAERPTRVGGDPEAAEKIGLEVGATPTMDAITRVTKGLHAETGAWPGKGHKPLDDAERTAYHDFVFSVPKSVSVEFAAARAAGDEVRAGQLIGAMTESVEAAIGQIQELLPLGRRREGREGTRRAVPAKVAALLDVHSAARPVKGQTSGDPHLHVHARILNLGLQDNGEVASVNYWMLYRNVRSLNALFECGLRSRLEELGYPTVDATHGERREWASFELTRHDERLSTALSARTEHVEMLATREWEERQAELLAGLQIASALRAVAGLPSDPVTELTVAQREAVKPTAKEVAALSRASREQKLSTSHAELAAEWGRVCAAHGYRHLPSDPPQPSCRPAGSARERAMAQIAGEALSLDGLVAGRSVFDRADILEHVSAPAVQGHLDEAEMRRLVERVEADAVSLPATVHEPLGAFTTREQERLEHEAVALVVAFADEATVGVPEALVGTAIADDERITGRALAPEQAEAVRALCAPAGWVQLVGVAGSGKTSVCRPAVRALEGAGYAVVGVSLSQAATDVLAGETGVPAWNLADFVTRVTHDALRTTDGTPVSIGPRTVILLDEAGTVDSRTWHAFTRICQDWRVAGVRVLGDPDQSQPVGSGSILGWLARHLPTTYLTENRRQGLGGVEVEAAQLLRDGRGIDFVRLKDRQGQLWIDVSREASISRAADAWAGGIAAGGDPSQHVLLSDLVEVVSRLNHEARSRYRALGRLGDGGLVIAGREWAIGDRVVFAERHRVRVPVIRADGRPEHRRAGAPRTRTLRTPRRTQGELVGIGGGQDGGVVLRIRTDARGRLPSRLVEVSATEVPGTLDYGYAMTTQVAQGRSWDTTYRVLTASRLSGRQTEYPAQTRHLSRSLLFGDTQSVHAEAGDGVSLRDDTIERYGELISRDVAKLTTLDYLSPEDRELLEQRLAPRYLRTPAYTARAPMSGRQADFLLALKREPGWGWSWVRASVEIDLALGHPAGQSALSWMTEQGVSPQAAWTAVDGACREAGVRNPVPEPAPEVPSVAPDWDTAATVDAARTERETATTAGRQSGGAHPATAVPDTDASDHSVRAAGTDPPLAPQGRRPEGTQETGLATIRQVIEQIRERYPELGRRGDPPKLSAPLTPSPETTSPRPSDDQLRRHRQRAREAADRARREAQRRRGPYAS
jgi:conjugative relaxase-like TrwC/TraI family protein